MKTTSLLFAFACITSLSFAQKYEVKKGKIALDKNVIATYDGKGSILRMFDLTISTPGLKPLITLKEKYYEFKNPLRRNGDRWIDITFLGNPEKKMGYHFKNDMRLIERDLVGLLFKDGATALIQGEELNAPAVDDYIKTNNFDFVADSIYIRNFEKENREHIIEPLSRDKSLPVKVIFVDKSRDVNSDNEDYTYTYDIFQDDVLLGQVEKTISHPLGGGTKVFYQILKRSLTPYTVDGKQMKFGILAFVQTDSPTFEQELILMTNKNTMKYKTPDHTESQHQIVNLLVTNGIL